MSLSMPLHEFARFRLIAKPSSTGNITLSFRPCQTLFNDLPESDVLLHFDTIFENGVNALSVYLSSPSTELKDMFQKAISGNRTSIIVNLSICVEFKFALLESPQRSQGDQAVLANLQLNSIWPESSHPKPSMFTHMSDMSLPTPPADVNPGNDHFGLQQSDIDQLNTLLTQNHEMRESLFFIV